MTKRNTYLVASVALLRASTSVDRPVKVDARLALSTARERETKSHGPQLRPAVLAEAERAAAAAAVNRDASPPRPTAVAAPPSNKLLGGCLIRNMICTLEPKLHPEAGGFASGG